MSDDKTPVQADGDGKPSETPQGHEGAGESGGGAYKQTHVQDGDNRERARPLNTGRKPTT